MNETALMHIQVYAEVNGKEIEEFHVFGGRPGRCYS